MRQRIRKACLPCRRRKRKCDGQNPCASCIKYEYNCVYERPAKEDGLNDSATQAFDATFDNASSTGGLSSPNHMSSTIRSTQKAPQHIGRKQGFLDPQKSRYSNNESSVSFPRALALRLETSNLPRLHAFAYHAGVRPEPAFTQVRILKSLISLSQSRDLVGKYEATVHRMFGFLDLEMFNNQLDTYWTGNSQDNAFEAILCGVIALGSLFSGLLTEQVEAKIVEHAKSLLESPFWISPPSIYWVMAWNLRTIYLRMTSRPHTTWVCSCTAMHTAEAVGLHRRPEEVTLVVSSASRLSKETVELRERTFQVAQSLNLLISYEYGRSFVQMGRHLPSLLTPRTNDFTDEVCGLINLIAPDTTSMDDTTKHTDLFDQLQNVHGAKAGHDFVKLLKAEIAYCIYRRLQHFELALEEEKMDQIINIGLSALQAALRLAISGQPWWNILGTVFHFVCVLLSINTNSSLARLPQAMQTLDRLVQHLDTHLAREALQTAKDLVCASLEQRQNGLRSLEAALNSSPGDFDSPPMESAVPDVDWNIFLQPFDHYQAVDTLFSRGPESSI